MRSPLPSIHAIQQGARPLTQTLMDFGQDYRHAEAYAMLYLLATRHLVTRALSELNPNLRILFDFSRDDLLLIVSLGPVSVIHPVGQYAFHAALQAGLPSQAFLQWMVHQTGQPEQAILSLQASEHDQLAARLLAARLLFELESLIYARRGIEA